MRGHPPADRSAYLVKFRFTAPPAL